MPHRSGRGSMPGTQTSTYVQVAFSSDRQQDLSAEELLAAMAGDLQDVGEGASGDDLEWEDVGDGAVAATNGACAPSCPPHLLIFLTCLCLAPMLRTCCVHPGGCEVVQ